MFLLRFCSLMKGSISRLLCTVLDVRLRVEWLIVMVVTMLPGWCENMR